MTITKRAVSLILILLMAVSILPMSVFAAGPIKTDTVCSMTVDYKYESTPIPGANFQIYKIADVDAYVQFTLTSKFEKYPVRLEDNTEESWNTLALTMKGYVQADNIAPDYTATTDANGKFTLNDLTTGLYLFVGDKCVVDDYTYTTAPFIVCVPNRDATTDEWIYDVTVVPKPTREKNPEEPVDETVTRKVLKVWDDKGHVSKRPKEIVVQLLKDGEVYDTVTLNAANNWRYAWEELPAYNEDGTRIEWTVVEKDVSGYTVKIEQSGVTFVITNTYEPPTTTPTETKPPKLPQTGLMWWPVPLLALLGFAFIGIGILRRRSQK